MQNAHLTPRDAYFVKHADRHQRRIDELKGKNREYQQIIDRFPDGDAIPELKEQIAKNNAEIKTLSGKVGRIMANVRR